MCTVASGLGESASGLEMCSIARIDRDTVILRTIDDFTSRFAGLHKLYTENEECPRHGSVRRCLIERMESGC